MFNSSSLRLFSLLFCNNLAFYTICYYFSSVIYKNTCPRCSSRQFPYFISHRLPRLSLLNICSNTPVFTYHPIYINLLESRSDHVLLVTCLFLLFLTSYLFIEILKLPVLAAAPDNCLTLYHFNIILQVVNIHFLCKFHGSTLFLYPMNIYLLIPLFVTSFFMIYLF